MEVLYEGEHIAGGAAGMAFVGDLFFAEYREAVIVPAEGARIEKYILPLSFWLSADLLGNDLNQVGAGLYFFKWIDGCNVSLVCYCHFPPPHKSLELTLMP
jgi:hypothetical protein